MRYYSDILDQVFETEELCRQAEEEYIKAMDPPEEDGGTDECTDCSTKSSVDRKDSVTPTKKDLADRVQECEEKLKEAYELHSVAEQKANEISKRYLEELDKIMSPANKSVKDAEAAKYKAIRDFNDAYGVYRASYTGAKAAEEFKRAIKQFEATRKWVDNFFGWF